MDWTLDRMLRPTRSRLDIGVLAVDHAAAMGRHLTPELQRDRTLRVLGVESLLIAAGVLP